MTDPLQVLADNVERGWLVGGALRDRLLGRETADYDVVIAESDDLERVARALARQGGGVAFALSDEFGAWRVVAHDHSWQVDLSALDGETLEADLRRRDVTINALARPLGGDDESLIDPLGGLGDLRAGRLRAASDRAFTGDPLRVLRLARMVAELDFEVDGNTIALARAGVGGLERVAAERVFGELRRLLCSDLALIGLDTMDATGATAVVLPELAELRGIDQSRFHHLDVYDHTRAVLAEMIALERDPEPAFGPAADAVRGLLSQPFADELSRGGALRFAALLHDIAKPQTRAVTEEGRVTFMRHDEAGAAMSTTILRRLRASARLAEYVAALTRHHLRLGFLVHRMPLNRREIYRYLDACHPVAADVTVLSVADRLATRGDNSERAISRHLELARQMLGEALAWAADPPRPPIRGDELGSALGIRPGPLLGELLHELEEAAYAGEVSSAEEAIGYARQRVSR